MLLKEKDCEPKSINGSLNLKKEIEKFLNWYSKTLTKEGYSFNDVKNRVTKLQNLIEKVAVWYELIYPDYEIDNLFSNNKINLSVSNAMFKNNSYFKDKNLDINSLDWPSFYNFDAFVSSLSLDEMCLLTKPSYNSILYFKPGDFPHLHLNSDGTVDSAECVNFFTGGKVSNQELIGLSLSDVLEVFKEKGIKLPIDNELKPELQRANRNINRHNGLLKAILYRIIERGGNRIGPRRALLFAKEFNLNIDIPMICGVDYSDPGLRTFVNEYIKAGGSPNLICYIDYFSQVRRFTKLDTTTVKELIDTVPHDNLNFYTPEEQDLQERLIKALNKGIDSTKLAKEEAKALRLERKLERSRKFKKQG